MAKKREATVLVNFKAPVKMKARMSLVKTVNWSAVLREAVEAKLKAEGK